MWHSIYGLDIETDTSPLTEAEIAAGHTSRGLDPRISRIINVAIATKGEVIVLEGDEDDILADLDNFFRNSRPGLITTWNGSVFDLPFIEARANIWGNSVSLRLSPDDRIIPKYSPLPGHNGGYQASWANNIGVEHAHLDIAYCYELFAKDAEIPWSLKPVAEHLGLKPIKLDAARLHEYSAAEIREYVASDARVTRELTRLLLPYRE